MVLTGTEAPQAWLSEDGRTVYVRRGGWQSSFPVSALGRWLSFYRSLRDGKGGRYAAYYAPMVEALARLERDVRSAE